MTNSVKLRISDLQRLQSWLEDRQLTEKNYPVKIVQSGSSGIGTTIEVFVETAEGEGVYKDITDLDSW